MEEKVYIAIYNGECATGSSPDEAKRRLESDCTHNPNFIDINFYEAKLLKVKQIIIIENEEKKSSLQ